jgi:uncharacterized protein (DUF2384 family)
MGVLDRIRSIFGGRPDVDDEVVTEEEAERIREETEVSGVWTDIEQEQAKARDRMQNMPSPDDHYR